MVDATAQDLEGHGLVRQMAEAPVLLGSGRPLSVPQWGGLLVGTLVVLSPAIIGFLAYLASWIGWPGFAQSADFGLTGTEWLGDMYFGLTATTVGLYAVIMLCAALLPGDLHAGTGWLETAPESPPRSGGARPSDPAGDSVDPTGIWWPYAAGAVAVVGGILVTVWPHLPR